MNTLTKQIIAGVASAAYTLIVVANLVGYFFSPLVKAKVDQDLLCGIVFLGAIIFCTMFALAAYSKCDELGDKRKAEHKARVRALAVARAAEKAEFDALFRSACMSHGGPDEDEGFADEVAQPLSSGAQADAEMLRIENEFNMRHLMYMQSKGRDNHYPLPSDLPFLN